MITNLNELADRLTGIKVDGKELTVDQLKELMTKEDEVSLEIPQVNVFTDDKLNELKETVKKQGYEDARTPIKEMTMKELKNISGLDIEGYKDPNKFLSAYKDSILSEAKVEPNKKINELNASLENLRTTMQMEIEKKEQEVSGYRKKMKDSTISNTLLRKIPKDLKGVTADQAAKLYRSERTLDLTDNGIVLMDGENIVKDKFEKPVNIEDDLMAFFKQNGWLKGDGRNDGNYSDGAGGSDFKTKNDIFKYMNENRIDPTSKEGLKLLNDFEKSQS